MANDKSAPEIRKIGLIGFGEAGSLLGEGLVKAGLWVTAYDIKCHDANALSSLEQRAEAAGVLLAASLEQAVSSVDLVVSAVTASSAAQVAEQAGPLMRAGQYFLDINSVSPSTKAHDRNAIESAGAAYVEAAVMAPVPPYGLHVPMLLGGSQAQAVSTALNALGMRTRAVSADVGVASAIKMCRSVMIKGIEALTVECLTAARRYGAEHEVLASLAETFPGMGWTEKQPHYLISRVAEHGRRRAAEMREVAETLSDAQVDPVMALATATLQDAFVDLMAAKGVAYPKDQAFDWPSFIDQLRN
ncbi:6-phosphogluconate dehydrogenase [Pusillimonas sp. T2]|uniref:NAD(P)-dependent oxidoreductase n=1 Tax=Pusillimonas sp. T2 TaxID=1548123 RepID=UPI000B946509|nr:DUF1932 domain-containing protein [Pusillimonas sp. T2]OXR48261.1 6-phosphogluconate dehydrogenase [Pusillimonas sp. T2]